MKMNKNKTLCCGNYDCHWNFDGCCGQDVIALDSSGKCTLEKLKPKYEGITVHYKKADGGNPVEDVPTPLSKLVPPLD